MKVESLCAGLTFQITATESLANKQDASRRIVASQETGPRSDDNQTRRGTYIPREVCNPAYPATTYSTREEQITNTDRQWDHRHQRGPQMFARMEINQCENHQSQ